MSAVGELFDLLSLFTDATAAGAARAVLGCGIGPLGFSRLRDNAIFRLLSLSQETVFRDQASWDLARTQLSFSGPASVLPDPAFIWAQWQIQRMSIQAAGGPVLLALREWQVHEYAAALPPEKAAEVKQLFERE